MAALSDYFMHPGPSRSELVVSYVRNSALLQAAFLSTCSNQMMRDNNNTTSKQACLQSPVNIFPGAALMPSQSRNGRRSEELCSIRRATQTA